MRERERASEKRTRAVPLPTSDKTYPLGQLVDRALDLKPEVAQGCGFESRLWQEVHDCSPGAAQSAAHWFCQVCALGWVKSGEHISLLIILCIIVYVTNKAHLSLICIVLYLYCASLRVPP